MPDRSGVQGDRIAGQFYYDIYFTGGDIENATLTNVIINGASSNRNETILTAAGNYSVISTDYIITVQKTAPQITSIILPASPVTSRSIIVKDGSGNAASFPITINGNGKNIDGAASFILNLNYSSVEIVYNGTQWNVIGNYLESDGNVVGPGSSTDNAIARFNGTSGASIQNSGVIIDDSNNISGVVDLSASGQISSLTDIIQGSATPINTTNIPTPGISAMTTSGNPGFCMARFANNNGNGKIFLVKSRGATIGSNVVVQTGDGLGTFEFYGASGSDYQRGAFILATVTDPSPSATAMGSDLRFFTAAASATGGSERLTIKSNGNILVGTTSDVSGKIQVLSTTEQLRLNFDSSNRASFTVGSNGNLGLNFGGVGGVTLFQPTDAVASGLGIINTTVTGSLRIWADSSNIGRIDSASTGNGNIAINGAGTGNVLIGTTTNSSNGRLQLASSTVIGGGIGFGTDIALYRTGSTGLEMTSGAASNATLSLKSPSFTANAITLSNSNGSLILGSSAGNVLTLDSSLNATVVGQLVAGTNVFLSAGTGTFAWSSRARMRSPSDGVMTLLNTAETDFSRLQFGGTTSSFPALKRSTTELHAVLADDSGFTTFRAGGANFTGNVTGATFIPTSGSAPTNGMYLSAANTLAFSTNSTAALTISSSQSATFAGAIIGSVQALSGAGSVNVTQLTTAYTSTGVLDALTLANGSAGQIKTIVHVVDGGSGILTPTTPLGYSTITFTNAGDSVTLQYFTQGWSIIGFKGVTIA